MHQRKISGGISDAEVPPEERGVPNPHQVPKPRVPVPGREVLVTSGCENQQRLWLRQRESGSSSLTACAQTYSNSLALSSSTGTVAWKTPGGLASRWELQGQLSPRQKWWQRPLFIFWACHTQSLQAGAISESPSTWLTLFSLPERFPETPPHPIQLAGPSRLFPVAFPYNWPLFWLMLRTFLKPLKQAASGLGVHHTSS